MTDIEEREKLDERILEIALASLAAGEALPPIAESRALVSTRWVYGMHLPNRFNGWSEGLKRELEATLPVSLTFLDNVKGEGLVQAVDLLHSRGVKPTLVYRPYFRPNDGVNAAIVEGYAHGAAIMMRDDYFRHPLLRQAYDEGRWIVKFFNETNIGGEGFPRGRAGFADALRYWKQARGVMKAAYPLARLLSICNTPGNDDVWFSGDAANLPYWYHGPEAAKANPTQADIQRAIQTCPFREMFELADDIGIHVYGNLTRTVSGDLQTWYSRRHEQALKFLTPYTAAGKKLIINEWDMGYDDGQEARARDVVYTLANIVGPNDAILFVNQWWNGDDGEGAETWEKHQTRKGGAFRPVVGAVKAFRDGASQPPPDEPPPADPPPPSGGAIVLPDWCTVIRAVVPTGQRYWHLKRAYWQDWDESGGTHHIYALEPHDALVSMAVTWQGGSALAPLEKPIGEPAGNHPMWGEDVYTAGLTGRGVTLSDKVSGLEMPENQHVSYFLEWELRTKEGETPMPPTSLETLVLQEGATVATVPITPGFALFDAIIRDDLIPNGLEKYIEHDGKRYALRSAEHASNGGAYVYYVEIGRWGDIRRLVRRPPNEAAPPIFSIDRQFMGRAGIGENYSPRPAGERARGIILHHTGGGFIGSLNHLTDAASGVGTHYLVDRDGKIYQLVEDHMAAWHAGYSILDGREDANGFTLGVEIVNAGDGKEAYPPVQIAAVEWLLKEKAREHRIPREWVGTHKDVRAAYLAKYPGAVDRNGRRISGKVDPRGLDVPALLNRVYAV